MNIFNFGGPSFGGGPTSLLQALINKLMKEMPALTKEAATIIAKIILKV